MIIKNDQDIIKKYLEDTANLAGANAEAVYFPENEKEISDILRECSEKKKTVTVSGAGTGVAGARVPFGGVVLATDKLNKIIDINQKEKIIKLQPAVSLENIHNNISSLDLAYNPDSTEKSAFIGGNIATNASGARAFKYGVTRQYIKSLNIILSNGKKISISRGKIFAKNRKIDIPNFKKISLPDYTSPEIKNSAGYYVKPNMDLVDLFIGQEGTLGVVSEAELLLVPKPEKIFSCFAFFKELSEALNFAKNVKLMRHQGGLSPLTLEFMDEFALELLRKEYPNIPHSKAAIFFEQETSVSKEEELMLKWLELLEKYGVSESQTWFADNPKKEKELNEFRWKLPELVNETIKRNNVSKVGTDIAVPEASFDEMFVFYQKELGQVKMPYLIFGHIGDNHLHVNLLPSNQNEIKKAKEIYLKFAKKAVALKGTVSAEHGIGKTKHAFLEAMYGINNIQAMANLKKQIDASCILSPGNIFSANYLA